MTPDALSQQLSVVPWACGACANPCDDCQTAWERDRYRKALTNVLAFACAGERLTKKQQLRNIYYAAKVALDEQ